MNSTVTGMGNRLRAVRKQQGLSQMGLAKAAGLSQSAIATYERAARIPTLENAYRLAHILGCTVTDIWKPYIKRTAEVEE